MFKKKDKSLENQPSTLEISVAEDIKMTEVAPGTHAPVKEYAVFANEDVEVQEASPGTPAPTAKEIEESSPRRS
jgi:hypothetical protein